MEERIDRDCEKCKGCEKSSMTAEELEKLFHNLILENFRKFNETKGCSEEEKVS